jgi:hypothetical protein
MDLKADTKSLVVGRDIQRSPCQNFGRQKTGFGRFFATRAFFNRSGRTKPYS